MIGALALAAAALGATGGIHAQSAADTRKPNILLILVDDMGYGDPQCFNPTSRIKTPGIDRLAREGMMFRDAHAPHATCIGSRYGLLTGRYPVRDRYTSIKPDKITLPKLLFPPRAVF